LTSRETADAFSGERCPRTAAPFIPGQLVRRLAQTPPGSLAGAGPGVRVPGQGSPTWCSGQDPGTGYRNKASGARGLARSVVSSPPSPAVQRRRVNVLNPVL